MELGNLGRKRLEINRRELGIDPYAEVIQNEVVDILLDLVESIKSSREHVVVGDDKEAVILGLQSDAVFQASNVMSDVQLSRRSVAGQDALAGLDRFAFRSRQSPFGFNRHFVLLFDKAKLDNKKPLVPRWGTRGPRCHPNSATSKSASRHFVAPRADRLLDR